MSKRKKWDNEHGQPDAAEQPYVSRTERTRATQVINKMGLQLAGLPPTVLDQLELPEELREAIDLCQRLKVKSRRRQQRLVCQLLREEDHEAIIKRVQALDVLKSGSHRKG